MKAVRLHLGIPELNKYAGPLDSCCYSRKSLEMDGIPLTLRSLLNKQAELSKQGGIFLKNS